jgi:hypothetical protein
MDDFFRLFYRFLVTLKEYFVSKLGGYDSEHFLYYLEGFIELAVKKAASFSLSEFLISLVIIIPLTCFKCYEILQTLAFLILRTILPLSILKPPIMTL